MNWYEKFENSACLPHDRIDEGGNPRDTSNQITVTSFRRLLVAIIVTICASIGLVYYSFVRQQRLVSYRYSSDLNFCFC